MRFGLWAVLAAALALRAQPASPEPRFEAAVIRPSTGEFSQFLQAFGQSPALDAQPGVVPRVNPGRVRLRNISLVSLLVMAYGVASSRIKGPDWMQNEYFDLEAVVPPGTADSQLRAMLQSLLQERFKLNLHSETRETYGYALKISKSGLLLKPAPDEDPASGDPASRREAMKQMRRGMGGRSAMPGWETSHFRRTSMEQLARVLERLLGVPVMDETDLPGKYEADLNIETDPARRTESIFEAVGEMGLTLSRKLVRVPIQVVDSISKMPTSN